MTAPISHPDIEELVDWARGTLSRRRLREIRSHCRTCPACDMKLAKILVIRTRQRREMKRRLKRQRQLQMAAAIVLLVGAGAVFLFSGYSSDPGSELAELATTETIPESHVHLRFRVALPASPDRYEYEEKLKAGMEALVRREYHQALEVLEELYGEHQESSEGAAYLGVAYYLSGDDSDRTRSFLAHGARNAHGMISRTATWYLANSCLRSGNVDSAIELLGILDPSQINDMYGRWSVELLRQVEDIQDP